MPGSEERPRLVTSNVVTLDGRLGLSFSPSWEDRRWMDAVKHFEVVDVAALHAARVRIVGANSFVPRDSVGDPPSELRLDRPDYLPPEVMSRFDHWMAVTDSRGRVRWGIKEVGGMHVVVLATQRTPESHLGWLRVEDIPYLLCGEDRVDLSMALRRLAAVFDAETILGDGGGILNGLLLGAGLVDEVNIQWLPIVVGEVEAPKLFEGCRLAELERPLRFETIEVQPRSDGSLFARYRPHA